MAVSSVDDRELVESHKAGNDGAFAQIVEAYYPELLAHARRRLREPRSAEDAVQESFLRAYRALGRFNGEYRLGAWLHRIVENVCADEGNRRRRETELVDKITALPITRNGEPEPHDVAAARMPDPGFVKALANLSPTYREALLLRYVEGMAYREVAEATGVTEENARARVHRARTALRKMVGGGVAVVAWLIAGARKSERAFAEGVSRVHQPLEEAAVRLSPAATQIMTASAAVPAKGAMAARVAAIAAAVTIPMAGAGVATHVERVRPAQVAPAEVATTPVTEMVTDTTLSIATSTTAVTVPALIEGLVAAVTNLPTPTGPAAPAPKGSSDKAEGPREVDGDTDRWEWFNPEEQRTDPAGEGKGSEDQQPAEAHEVRVAAEGLPVEVSGSTAELEGEGRLLLPEGPASGQIHASLDLGQGDYEGAPAGFTLRFTEDAQRSAPLQVRFAGVLVERVNDGGVHRYRVQGSYEVQGNDERIDAQGRFTAVFVMGDFGSLDVTFQPG